MDCEQALALLTADIDRETQPDESVRLRAHLQECAACRASADAFRLQDADLRRLFASRRRAAAGVADRVIARLAAPPVPRGHRLPWLPILVAAAAGFLLAVLVFRPSERGADRIARGERNVLEPQGQGQSPAAAHETDGIVRAVAKNAVGF